MTAKANLTSSTIPAVAASSAGTKRKREMPAKFYAVRTGKEPGIYHSWNECLEQVRGHPKAVFKSFTMLDDAEAFLKGEEEFANGSASVTRPGAPQRYYGVQVGKVPGVYTNWQDVLKQITAYRNPKHKSFKTRIEAELYVKEGQQQSQGGVYGEAVVDSVETADGSARKKLKKGHGIKQEGSPDSGAAITLTDYEPGEAPLNGAEDDFDTNIILDPSTGSLRYKTAEERARVKYQAVRPVPDAPIRIYTDGSTLANGQARAVGGVGVYFGPKDARNVSEGLAGSKQTNQRAELTAILRALEAAPKDRRIIIISDSNYAINCVNEWFLNWRANGWLNASRKPVENRDLIQKIIDHLEERQRINQHRSDSTQGADGVDEDGNLPGYWDKGPAGVKFVWVKGHAKNAGNNAADELATAGAREARELLNADFDG